MAFRAKPTRDPEADPSLQAVTASQRRREATEGTKPIGLAS